MRCAATRRAPTSIGEQRRHHLHAALEHAPRRTGAERLARPEARVGRVVLEHDVDVVADHARITGASVPRCDQLGSAGAGPRVLEKLVAEGRFELPTKGL